MAVCLALAGSGRAGAQAPGTFDLSFFADGALGADDLAGFPSATPVVVADSAGRLVFAEAAPAGDGSLILRRVSDGGAQLVRLLAVVGGATHRPLSLARTPSGRLLVAGEARLANGNRWLFVALMDSNLNLVTSFGGSGFVLRFWGAVPVYNASVAMGTDGSVYAVGGSVGSSGEDVSFLLRWSATGSSTYAFREMNFGIHESLVRVFPLPGDRVLIAGWTRDVAVQPGEQQPVTATWFVQRRAGPLGLIDGGFGRLGTTIITWPVLIPGILATLPPVALVNQLGGMALDSSGRIYLGGRVTTSIGTQGFVVRLTTSGAPDATFGSQGKALANFGQYPGFGWVDDLAVVEGAASAPAILLWGRFCDPNPLCQAVLHARTFNGTLYPGFGSEPTWSRTAFDATDFGESLGLYHIATGRLSMSPVGPKIYAAVGFSGDEFPGDPPLPPVAFALRFWTPN